MKTGTTSAERKKLRQRRGAMLLSVMLTVGLSLAIPLLARIIGEKRESLPPVPPETERTAEGSALEVTAPEAPTAYGTEEDTAGEEGDPPEEPKTSPPPAITEEPETENPEAEPPKTEKKTVPAQTAAEEQPVTVRVLDNDTGKVTVMPLDDYITCVVSAEMPYTFHSEALKAQAVAARSYCLNKIINGSGHKSADVCTSYAHCAAYVTEKELIGKYGSDTAKKITKKVRAAVEATAGEIITYKGVPALALFHSGSAGYTESAKNVWGGKVPYLVAVPTPEEDSVSTVFVSDGDLAAAFLTDAAVKVGTAPSRTALLTSVLNDTGRQDILYYNGSEIRAKALRSAFGLRSCDFTYERTEGGWTFTVHGYGHGVGMSQYGANTMAIGGASYREILTHYYTGVTLSALRDVLK